MKQIIDIETWERKNIYTYFASFLNPNFSITADVECGNAKENAKQRGQSFFICYVYAILRAANEIKELRYRHEDGKVVLYDHVDLSTAVKTGDNGEYAGARIPYIEDFETFYKEALQIIKNIPKGKEPFEEDLKQGASGVEDVGVILVSAMPDLYFSATTPAQMKAGGNQYPLLNVGKMVLREGKNYIPVSITADHGFVDGFHFTAFFKKTEEYLKSL